MHVVYWVQLMMLTLALRMLLVQTLSSMAAHLCRHAGCAQSYLLCCRSRFAADGGGPAAAARDFKQLVKQLHEAGIEVILDVVYNHTVEGASLVSTESTRDNPRCVHRFLKCS